MALFQIFFQSLMLALSGAVMPGPLLPYTIQLSYKKGFKVGPRIILGHAILEAALIVALIAGLGNVLAIPGTKISLWLIGGVLLAWMGYDLIWKESRKPMFSAGEVAAASEISPERGLTNLPPVAAGIVISATNPYWALWWVTIGLGYITKTLQFGWLGVVIFFLGHILADLAWYSLIAGAMAIGRQCITPKIYKGLLIVCGVFLCFVSLGFILDALKALGWINFLVLKLY